MNLGLAITCFGALKDAGDEEGRGVGLLSVEQVGAITGG